MDRVRPFLIASLLLALAPAASASPSGSSGGAVAEPLRQGEGGGALAPERYASPAASESASAGRAPVAEAARDEPPRWEPEPPKRDWAPYPGGAKRTAGQAAGGDAELRTAADGTESVPASREPAGGGSLPWTGLEIAALAALGLGLLTLGAALRPRRRRRA